MGTTIMAHGSSGIRWCALLEAAAEQESQYDSTSMEGMGLPLPSYGLQSWAWPSEQSDEEDEGHARTKPKRKRDYTSKTVAIPGGPCQHCGVTESPQWRRPIDKDQTLCNACGIYYGRHKSLPRSKTKPAASIPPAVPTAPAPIAPPEILLKPLRAIRTRSPTIKGRSPTSSESHNEAHNANEESEPDASMAPSKRGRSAVSAHVPAVGGSAALDALHELLVRAGPLGPHNNALERADAGAASTLAFGAIAAAAAALGGGAFQLQRPPLIVTTPSSPSDSNLSSHHHMASQGPHARTAASTLDAAATFESATDMDGGSASQQLSHVLQVDHMAGAQPAHALGRGQRRRRSASGTPAFMALADASEQLAGDMLMSLAGQPAAASKAVTATQPQPVQRRQPVHLVPPHPVAVLLPVLRCQAPRSINRGALAALLSEPSLSVAAAGVSSASAADELLSRAAEPATAVEGTVHGQAAAVLAPSGSTPTASQGMMEAGVAVEAVAATAQVVAPVPDEAGVIMLRTLKSRGPRCGWLRTANSDTPTPPT